MLRAALLALIAALALARAPRDVLPLGVAAVLVRAVVRGGGRP